MRPARVGEEPDPLMAHYALYAVKQNSGVKITLVDQGAHDKLHVVSIDLDKPDEVAVGAIENVQVCVVPEPIRSCSDCRAAAAVV